MTSDFKKLSLNGKTILIEKIAQDYKLLNDMEVPVCPKTNIYHFISDEESPIVQTKARTAALESLNAERRMRPKLAFDTRRIDQENNRIPRKNLQFWHRSGEFIEPGDQDKINTFSSLYGILKDLKEEFGTRPDWHDSYARVLHDAVGRVLRIKQGDNDISRAQLAYLEQLLDTRYQLNIEKIKSMGSTELKSRILQRDETLLKRGLIYDDKIAGLENRIMKFVSGALQPKLEKQSSDVKSPGQNIINVYPNESNNVKTSAPNNDSANNVLASIFGTPVRKDGERQVERTVTITIRDEVKG